MGINMNRLVGIVGSGMIGRDPFDERCWSGSSRNLFIEMQKHGILERAFGVEANKIDRSYFLIKNFYLNKRIWREKFNLDPGYYQALTKAVRNKCVDSDYDNMFFQIGAHYDIPSIARGAKCFSYHDGNIAIKMKSPYFPAKLLNSAYRAFRWEKMVSNKMDMIFTMSEYLRQSFINDYGVNPEKVKNIGVGLNFPLPNNKIVKDYNNIELLFIGIDFERKGGDLLVTTFKRLKELFPNLILNIVGPKTEPISIKGVNGINFYGFLNRDKPKDLKLFKEILNRSVLGVLPSKYEPFGIGVLEMMAYSMICILPNKWAFSEIIQDGHCGWLYENDEELFYVLKDIIGGKYSLELKSINSLKRVNDYSWKIVVDKIQDGIYGSMLNRVSN